MQVGALLAKNKSKLNLLNFQRHIFNTNPSSVPANELRYLEEADYVCQQTAQITHKTISD
jgi:hypothetical protein